MDVSTIVNYIQLAIWLVLIVGFIFRVKSGKQKMPRWLVSNKTIGAVIVVGVIASASAFYLNSRKCSETVSLPLPSTFRTAEPEPIVDKTFRNEKVLLDGFAYSDCKFYNVTFVYNGTAKFAFTHNNVYGSFGVSSDNPAVDAAFSLAKGLNLLKEDVPVYGPPGTRPIEPMKKGQQ